MLDKEGLKGPGDLAIVGDETEVRARLDDLRAIGVTDFTAAIAADNAEDAAPNPGLSCQRVLIRSAE